MPVGDIISRAFWMLAPPPPIYEHQNDEKGKYLLCPSVPYFSPEDTAGRRSPIYNEHCPESIVTPCLVLSIKGIVIINNLKYFIYILIIICPLQILLAIYNL
jgi:hypothetical protein